MSDKLVSLVAFYMTQKAQGENVDKAQIFKAEKRLEHEVEEEIVRERIEEIDDEVKRRENERAAACEFDEFRGILFQCVTLALLVGVIGSHLYGLLEALVYQPTAEVNVLFVTFGLLILLEITVVVLFKVYIKRLFESTKKFREFRKGR